MAYPSTLDTFTDPTANQKLNNPSHSAIERAQNAALAALEATVGVTGSAVATSLHYLVQNPLSVDPGHLHTLTGMIGTFPSSRITGTFPTTSITGTWPATALAGVVPTGNLPVGTNAGQLLIFPQNGILPAVNASALTDINGSSITGIIKVSVSSATQTINVGSGVTTDVTIPLPGGLLGTNNAIRFKIWFTTAASNNNGVAVSIILGGVTLQSYSNGGAVSGRTDTESVEVMILANGATNSQVCNVTDVGTVFVSTSTSHVINTLYTAVAIDSTISNDITFRSVGGGVSGGTTTLYGYTIEVIK